MKSLNRLNNMKKQLTTPLCLATAPSEWLGGHPKAFSSFTALLAYTESRFNTLWINPRFTFFPSRAHFVKKLRDLMSAGIIRKNEAIIFEPFIPHFEKYISIIKGYDGFYMKYWNFIVKITWQKTKHIIRTLRPKICVSATIFGGLLGTILKEREFVQYHIYYDLDKFSTLPSFYKISKQISCLERQIVRKADIVWSVSNTLSKLRKSQGAKKTLVVPNGVYLELFNRAVRLRELRSSREPKSPISIVYTSTIHPNWGTDILLEAFDLLIKKHYNVKLIMAGHGPNSQIGSIKKLQQRYPGKIVYFGVVQWTKLFKVLALGDIAVAPYRISGSAMYGAPLKIQEYMAAGLPVISTRTGVIPNLLEKNGAGIVVDDNSKELSKAIISLIENRKLRKKMARNALHAPNLIEWNSVFDSAFSWTFDALNINN